MKKVFIITNQIKDSNKDTTRRISSYLEDRGVECVVRPDSEGGNGNYLFTDARQIPDDVDAALVIGGDGTLIQAARDIVDTDIPILGINMGKLGYLTEVDRDNLSQSLDRLIEGTYEIEERMMLEGRVHSNAGPDTTAIALNDIVITRRGPLRVVSYRISVNGEYLNSYEADGIIIATPTGSTGYSLSAGGPIISPKASMVAITPICPHTLNTRSIVLAAEDEISICVEGRRQDAVEEAAVSFDGVQPVNLTENDSIDVRMSPKKTRLIKISKDSFLQVLGRKMRS